MGLTLLFFLFSLSWRLLFLLFPFYAFLYFLSPASELLSANYPSTAVERRRQWGPPLQLLSRIPLTLHGMMAACCVSVVYVHLKVACPDLASPFWTAVA
ncbi:hypothetical protein F4781DRAFT_413875 [Annulohypoxylon bovei var. microspora]|nr:hypothetical protein F4781DRAFT_413875 [Annulohypoxylon bovei var. microspora]